MPTTTYHMIYIVIHGYEPEDNLHFNVYCGLIQNSEER